MPGASTLVSQRRTIAETILFPQVVEMNPADIPLPPAPIVQGRPLSDMMREMIVLETTPMPGTYVLGLHLPSAQILIFGLDPLAGPRDVEELSDDLTISSPASLTPSEILHADELVQDESDVEAPNHEGSQPIQPEMVQTTSTTLFAQYVLRPDLQTEATLVTAVFLDNLDALLASPAGIPLPDSPVTAQAESETTPPTQVGELESSSTPESFQTAPQSLDLPATELTPSFDRNDPFMLEEGRLITEVLDLVHPQPRVFQRLHELPTRHRLANTSEWIRVTLAPSHPTSPTMASTTVPRVHGVSLAQRRRRLTPTAITIRPVFREIHWSSPRLSTSNRLHGLRSDSASEYSLPHNIEHEPSPREVTPSGLFHPETIGPFLLTGRPDLVPADHPFEVEHNPNGVLRRRFYRSVSTLILSPYSDEVPEDHPYEHEYDPFLSPSVLESRQVPHITPLPRTDHVQESELPPLPRSPLSGTTGVPCSSSPTLLDDDLAHAERALEADLEELRRWMDDVRPLRDIWAELDEILADGDWMDWDW